MDVWRTSTFYAATTSAGLLKIYFAPFFKYTPAHVFILIIALAQLKESNLSTTLRPSNAAQPADKYKWYENKRNQNGQKHCASCSVRSILTGEKGAYIVAENRVISSSTVSCAACLSSVYVIKVKSELTKFTFNSSQINALSPSGANRKYDEPLNSGTCKRTNKWLECKIWYLVIYYVCEDDDWWHFHLNAVLCCAVLRNLPLLTICLHTAEHTHTICERSEWMNEWRAHWRTSSKPLSLIAD